MKRSNIPLVRGDGELTQEMIDWIESVERVFPGTIKDLVLVRSKPNSPTPREGEKVLATRAGKSDR